MPLLRDASWSSMGRSWSIPPTPSTTFFESRHFRFGKLVTQTNPTQPTPPLNTQERYWEDRVTLHPVNRRLEIFRKMFFSKAYFGQETTLRFRNKNTSRVRKWYIFCIHQFWSLPYLTISKCSKLIIVYQKYLILSLLKQRSVQTFPGVTSRLDVGRYFGRFCIHDFQLDTRSHA